MLSDVCLSVAYIGPKSRTQRPRKTKIGTEVDDVTRDSDTTFKVKRSKVTRPALLNAALTREAGAAVTVRTYWAWETTATLRLHAAREALGHPRGEERGGAYRVATRTACYPVTLCVNAVFAVVACLSVRPSHAGIVSERLNLC